MILGGSLLIFSFSLGDGSHEQWIRSGVRMGSGHVSIERPEFRTSRKIEDRLAVEVRQAAERAIETPDIAPLVLAASAKLTISGLASSAVRCTPGADRSGRSHCGSGIQQARRPVGRGPISRAQRSTTCLCRRRTRLQSGPQAWFAFRRSGTGHQSGNCRAVVACGRNIPERCSGN